MREANEPVVRQHAYELMKEHLRRVEDTVRGVARLVDALVSEASPRGFSAASSAVWEMGEKADEAKGELMDFLARAGPSFLDKEDYLRLALKIGGLTDWMDGMAYRLRFLAESKPTVPRESRRSLKELTEAVLDVYDKFKEAFFLFGVNIEQAMKTCANVEQAERKVDKLQRDYDFEILKSGLPIPTMLLLRDIVFGLEETADLIEQASNDLRCIAVARLG